MTPERTEWMEWNTIETETKTYKWFCFGLTSVAGSFDFLFLYYKYVETKHTDYSILQHNATKNRLKHVPWQQCYQNALDTSKVWWQYILLLSKKRSWLPGIHIAMSLWAHNSNLVKILDPIFILMILQSDHKFMHATTAQPSWQVQSCDLFS